MNSFQKRVYIVLACVVLYLLLIVGWIVLERYVHSYINNKIRTVEQQHDITIPYENIEIKSLNNIRILNLAILPAGADTLLSAGFVDIKLNVAKLITFQPEISGIDIHELKLHFIDENNHINPNFFRNITGLSLNENTEDNYAQKADRYIHTLYNILPEKISLHNVWISCQQEELPQEILIKELTINDSRFVAEIKSRHDEWICQGAFLEEEQKIDLRLYGKENSKFSVPYVQEKYGFAAEFDTLVFEMQSIRKNDQLLSLQGKGGVKGLTVADDRLASDIIELDMGYANFFIEVGKNYLEIDNRTTLFCNKLKFNPYVKIEKNNDWHIIASVEKEDFPANELFESIPKGLFRHVEGLQADGTLSYHFLLDVDMAHVERLKFRSTLNAHDFHIVHYGKTDLRMMNEPFAHTIFEEGKAVRSFVLGDEHADYRSYRNISRYLPYAIMHAEDAEFFSHDGFLPDAFRRSLIENIKERRFARGGSTLSMQVVKNAFLNQDKTIARKLEEIMIVWLIETNKLVSKQRMFEVYMNISEWGPDVYGITEAARFYFDKEPAALTLTECTFLAYILPDPKHVKEHFNGLQIKPAFRHFHYDAVKRIYQRHWITERERAMSNPYLRITGPAATYLLKED